MVVISPQNQEKAEKENSFSIFLLFSSFPTFDTPHPHFHVPLKKVLKKTPKQINKLFYFF